MWRFHVYILSSHTRVLYIGVTNNLARRISEHQQRSVAGFTSQYHINRLVYYEEYQDVREAIAREKQLKSWRRVKKEQLIETLNPDWKDLSEQF